MHQTLLALGNEVATPLPGRKPVDAAGFDLGWEHAQHGLVPGPELLLQSMAVNQGWRAGRAVLGRRKLASNRALRQWLALRSLAWQQGVAFDTTALGPAELARLEPRCCPVRRQPLGGATQGDDAPVVFRLNPAAGYRPGNLVVLSRAASVAAKDATVAQALRQARAADACGMDVQGLHAAAWRRLTVLLSFTQSPAPAWAQGRALPAPTCLPLLVLPPPGVTPSNVVQQLQWRLTLLFLHPGWSARTRSLAAALPQDTQRTDFYLFVSALASRVLEALTPKPQAASGPGRSHLEDAWLHERVQQRWQQLALALGESGCQALLQRVQAQQGAADQGDGEALWLQGQGDKKRLSQAGRASSALRGGAQALKSPRPDLRTAASAQGRQRA